MALVATRRARWHILGLTRYDVDPATGLADVAFVVRETLAGPRHRHAADAAHGRGRLREALPASTPTCSLRTGRCCASSMRSGHKVTARLDHGTYFLEILFDPDKLGDRGLEPQASPPRPSRPAPR